MEHHIWAMFMQRMTGASAKLQSGTEPDEPRIFGLPVKLVEPDTLG
jgi:hypothetical protein